MTLGASLPTCAFDFNCRGTGRKPVPARVFSKHTILHSFAIALKQTTIPAMPPIQGTLQMQMPSTQGDALACPFSIAGGWNIAALQASNPTLFIGKFTRYTRKSCITKQMLNSITDPEKGQIWIAPYKMRGLWIVMLVGILTGFNYIIQINPHSKCWSHRMQKNIRRKTVPLLSEFLLPH